MRSETRAASISSRERCGNETGEPIDYVRLSYELLSDAGEVVYREFGYNRRAEGLREAWPEPLEPIPPSETETFRRFFLRDELPPFATYRVRVEEIGAGLPEANPPRRF